MAWEGPSIEKPVWCAVKGEKAGTPTAESVECVTKDPEGAQEGQVESASLNTSSMMMMAAKPVAAPLSYAKFTNQRALGNFLIDNYHIRKPNELSSCEVCHR
jgi:hypothetical protein